MKITILFFASLREQLGQASAEFIQDIDTTTVEQVWQAVTQRITLPDGIKVSVNQQYAALDTVLNDGDEVAFFPPVTGG